MRDNTATQTLPSNEAEDPNEYPAPWTDVVITEAWFADLAYLLEHRGIVDYMDRQPVPQGLPKALMPTIGQDDSTIPDLAVIFPEAAEALKRVQDNSPVAILMADHPSDDNVVVDGVQYDGERFRRLTALGCTTYTLEDGGMEVVLLDTGKYLI